MKKFPIALQLYSVRDFMEKDFEGTINAVAKMGYDGVEFAGMFGRSAKEVKEICAKAGVVPMSAHVGLADFMKDPEAMAKYYSELGLKYYAIPWLDAAYRPNGELYPVFKDAVKKIAEVSKKYGLTLSYHNHDFEFVTLDGEYLLTKMYKDLGPDELCVQLDCCWAEVGMGDPAAYLAQYPGRCPTVHLKDHVGTKGENMYKLIGKDADNDTASSGKEEFALCHLGAGKVDIKSVLDVAEKNGTEWVIIEQDTSTKGYTSLECAKMSIDYLKSIMK